MKNYMQSDTKKRNFNQNDSKLPASVLPESLVHFSSCGVFFFFSKKKTKTKNTQLPVIMNSHISGQTLNKLQG